MNMDDSASLLADAAGASDGHAIDRGRLSRVDASRRQFWLSVAGFLFVVLAAELVGRFRTTDFTRKIELARAVREDDVAFLGDSTAFHDFSPKAFAVAGGGRAVNLGYPSGSGIIAEPIAGALTVAPRHVVYAGLPVQLLDTFELQPMERTLVRWADLLRTGPRTADVILSKLSWVYNNHAGLSTLLTDKISSRFQSLVTPGGPAFPPIRSESDELGFTALFPSRPLTTAEREALALPVEPLWFARPDDTTRPGLRYLVLKRALQAVHAARRTIIIMPVSQPLRARVYSHLSRDQLRSRWLALAADTGFALLDCLEAVPDDAFADDDHLSVTGATAFSETLVSWFASETVPAGCEALAREGSVH